MGRKDKEGFLVENDVRWILRLLVRERRIVKMVDGRVRVECVDIVGNVLGNEGIEEDG